MENQVRIYHLVEQRPDKVPLHPRNPQQMATSHKCAPEDGQRSNKYQDLQEENTRPKNRPENMEKLPKGQPAQYEKLVRENGGFSGYSAKETSGSQQVTPTGAPGTSPTHSHRLVRKSISSRCHVETPTSLAYDQAFELHQKKKKKRVGPNEGWYSSIQGS